MYLGGRYPLFHRRMNYGLFILFQVAPVGCYGGSHKIKTLAECHSRTSLDWQANCTYEYMSDGIVILIFLSKVKICRNNAEFDGSDYNSASHRAGELTILRIIQEYIVILSLIILNLNHMLICNYFTIH